jgi:ribose-phosphate pyrophosphokinase
VVAPDLGAAKLAQRVAKALALPAAFVHKERRSGTDVGVRGLTGDVEGRRPLIVDDIISTGGTIEATVKLLLEARCAPAITVFATHGLFVGPALERLTPLPIERIIVSDSVPAPNTGTLKVQRVSLARLLADAASALHAGQSLEQLLSRT